MIMSFCENVYVFAHPLFSPKYVMLILDLFESRRPYYAEHSANQAVLKATGQRFYSGAFDPIDGHILEIHSWEEADDSDHHHSFYFTQNMVSKMEAGEACFFWFSRQKLHTMWRQGEAPAHVRRAILSQVEVSLIRPPTAGMNEDLREAPKTGPDSPIILYLPKGQTVISVIGYFREDEVVWGWVSSARPDQEIKPIGWSAIPK